MNDSTMQAAPEWGRFLRWHLAIAGLLTALLSLLWTTGFGPGGARCKLPMTPAIGVDLAAPAVAVAPPVLAAPTAAAPVVPPAPAAVAPAPAAVAPAPAVAPPAPAPAAVAALPPAARVYFGLDKTALPADVDKTLAEVVAYLKANGGAKALVSGFHDPSGDRAHNTELALNRARAVRAQLDKLGIPNDRVVMAKPAETTGTGTRQEARRVEVSVQSP